MKYMGSKSRIIDSIAPIIQAYVDASEMRYYYEPFCGGCNVIDHIRASERYAADNQKYLIALYQNLDKVNDLPAFVTKDHYDAVRNCYHSGSGRFEDWYIGAIGFLASYNGRFFDGGYAGLAQTKVGTERNYYVEAVQNLKRQIPRLSGVNFQCLDYRETKELSGVVIYCDPPYVGTKKYGSSKEFDHDVFWDWCREKSKKNIVIVSEHKAPDDFDCIWETTIKRTIDNNKRIDVKERLFVKKDAPTIIPASKEA